MTPSQGCARDLFGRDRDAKMCKTETRPRRCDSETRLRRYKLPRSLVKSSKQYSQVAAYRDNKVLLKRYQG